MKKIISKLMGGVLLFGLSMSLTSCEGALDDILGEWSRPTPGSSTGGAETSISISPTTLALKVGETGQLTATVDPAGTAVTWISDQEAIATVDANGLVTAKADGTATITAKAGDKSATCTVTVTEVYTAKDYKKASWNDTDKKVEFTKQTAPSDPTALTNSVTSWSGWYTVSGNVTITGNVTLGAETHLILQDGATLTINGQLYCKTNDLYIYGQKKGDGKLNVTNNSGTAINSNKHIDIHGGEVTASAAGDTSNGITTRYLAVYGGKLTATSGGVNGISFVNTIDVYGGEVVATSNATSSLVPYYGIIGSSSASKILTVYGGKVTATGNGKGYSPGYGSGFGCYVKSGTSGIKFYFSADVTTWGDGTSYTSATIVGLNDADAATKKRYAKAE